MANRFHLTENGPKPCNATVRDCPIGGAHFENKELAEQAFEFKADKKFGPFSGLRKKANPFTAHIAKAEKRIRSLESDMLVRDARQENGTLYHELRSEGITDELLEERFAEESNTRMSTVGYTMSEDAQAKAVGLTYGGDYKAEEEWGMAAITKALANGEYGPDDVLVYTKGDSTVLAIRGERTRAWTPDTETNTYLKRSEAEALSRYDSYTPYELWDTKMTVQNKSVADLRAELKGKVTPMPKTKPELIDAVVKLRVNKEFRTPAIGEFQTGAALVIVTKDPLEAKLMAKLKESHDGGNLRVGSTQNPFGRSALFYDDRDLTRSHKAELIRQEEANKAATAYIAETKERLNAVGNVYAVSTRVDPNLADVRDSTYWLNLSPRGRKQIFGMFTKDQLERIAGGDFSDVDTKE